MGTREPRVTTRVAAVIRAALLALPVTALDVALRLIGASQRLHFLAPGARERVWPVLPSTLLVHLALFFLVLGASVMLQGRRFAWVGVLGLQALVLAVALIHVTAYVYLMRAVSTLDWSVISYALHQPDSASMVALGEVDPLEWFMIGTFGALMLGHPLLLRWLVPGGSPIPARTSVAVGVLIAMIGFPVSTVGLLTPYAPDLDASILRDPIIHIYISYRADQLRDVGANGPLGTNESKFFDPVLEVARKPDAPPPRNIVVIVFESTRAESTTPYSPALGTTPFLADLARQGVQVDRSYTLVPATAKSMVSILCSLPSARATLPESFDRELLARCLPQLLANAGYDTVFMQTANYSFDRMDRMVVDMGFQSVIGPADLPKQGYQEANFLGVEDEAMLPASKAFLEKHREKPFFATYLTVNCHHDVMPLSRYPTIEYSKSEGLNRYLNAVRSDDFFLEKLIAQYKELGLYENTLFVLTADHGEGWGEHGRFTHVNTPYEEGVRVPLILLDPSHQLFSPAHLAGPTAHTDVMPTLLALMGYRVTHGELYGQSIFKVPPARPIDIACYGDCIARIEGFWKIIYFYSERPPELYDLSTDPHELHNVRTQYPDIAERMVRAAVEAQKAFDRFYWFHNLRAQKAKQKGN